MSNHMYAIPERFRKTENLHIVFWLIKDMSWAMLWKPLGLFMIVPTLLVAVMITWQTRKIPAELYHNLAVLCWITANCYWMIVEFMEVPDHYRYFAGIPFSVGMFFILLYYFVILPREKKQQKTVLMEVAVPDNIARITNAG